MDWNLEVVEIPVSDVDRSKGDSLDMAGFVLFSDPDGNSWAIQPMPGRG